MINLPTYIGNYVSEAVSTRGKKYSDFHLDANNSIEQTVNDLEEKGVNHISPEPGFLIVGMTMIGKGRDVVQEFKTSGLDPGVYYFVDMGMSRLHLIVMSKGFKSGYRITIQFAGEQVSVVEIYDIPSTKHTTYRGSVGVQNGVDKINDILDNA